MAASEGQTIWRKRVPIWITECPAYATKTRRSKAFNDVMESIVDRGTIVQTGPLRGSIIDCWGGPPLIKAAGCSESRFWDAIDWLYKGGYIVLLGMGGELRVVGPGSHRRRITSNYGVPGHRGAFDALADFTVLKREVRKVVTDAKGRRRMQVIEPGAQATLFHPEDLIPQSSSRQSDAGDFAASNIGEVHSEDRSGGVRRSEWFTPKIGDSSVAVSCPLNSPMDENNHAGARDPDDGVKRHGGKWFRVPESVFADYSEMTRFYTRCVAIGVAKRSDYGWDQFRAMVCRCKRLAQQNPAGMLGSMLRKQQWALLADGDFADAQAMETLMLKGFK